MKKILFLLVIGIAVVIVYSMDAPKQDFFAVYTENDKSAKDLKQFMNLPTQSINVDGVNWQYLKTGTGSKVILFTHGMGGAYNLWWQQVKAFEEQYTIITFTLPESINNLADTAKGIIKILDKENVNKFILVGTSMGGYIAQYLLSNIPNRIDKAVLSNTFPQNTLIPIKGKKTQNTIKWMPEIVIAHLGGKQLETNLLPAAAGSNLLRAILSYLPFSKKQFINRYSVVIDPFYDDPNAYQVKRIPKLIIESDNDPLIVKELREKLKAKYKHAQVYTFQGEGHFPYINASEQYNTALNDFFNSESQYLVVEATINNRYIKGRKNADIALLSSAFDDSALFYTSSNGTVIPITLENYFNKVIEDGPLILNTEIISGHIEDGMANFRVAFDYPDKSYSDNLVLLKTTSGWKIINKTFQKTK